MKRLTLAFAAALTTLATPALAASTLTIRFVGDCSDCARQVTATLVLQNFSLDGVNPNLTDANLVSFTYDGSNLFAPFTSSATSSLSGYLTDPVSPDPALPGLSGLITVAVQGYPDGSGRLFAATSHGAWAAYRTFGGAPEDHGGNSVFTGVANVPEIASWVMFVVGFGLIGGTLRGHRPTVRAA